jgi:DNA-binding transcriptional MerR regulator
MKIGEVAARAGVTVDTIRFYERRGLLARAPRTAAGYRTYSGVEVERLVLIKFLQGLEVSLDDIEVMLRMLDGGKATCANQTPAFEAVIERIDRDVERLQEARRKISDLLAFCGTGQCLFADGSPTRKRRLPLEALRSLHPSSASPKPVRPPRSTSMLRKARPG